MACWWARASARSSAASRVRPRSHVPNVRGFNVPLTFGAIGAGAGAAIGAGIDALRHARTRVPGSGARDRTEHRRKLTLSPVLGKDVQAVVGSLRF